MPTLKSAQTSVLKSQLNCRLLHTLCQRRCTSVLSSLHILQFSHFPPLQFCAAFSCLAISCPAFSATPLPFRCVILIKHCAPCTQTSTKFEVPSFEVGNYDAIFAISAALCRHVTLTFDLQHQLLMIWASATLPSTLFFLSLSVLTEG